MMTDDMQDHFPFDPPPPPTEPAGASYRHWSAHPDWGPPQWPPSPAGRGRSRPVRRALIAGLAVGCLGIGGGTAWAVTSATLTHPTTANLPAGNNQGGGPTGAPT